MDKVGRFYRSQDQGPGTHLALSWNGRIRFTVPRERTAQESCWMIFRPGRLEFPLRAMARLPWLFSAVDCVESADVATVRQSLGGEAGLSCCRAGTEGVWSKDTILLLDSGAKPLHIVKAGSGKAIDALLKNEASWLQKLQNHASLADHIPKVFVHRSAPELCFVAQSVLTGNLDFKLGKLQFEFLRKLQDYSLRSMRYEESALYRTLRSRWDDLNGLLPDTWSNRLDKALRRIEESLSGMPVMLGAAHNDFTPWNIRVQRGCVSVFDWEYAAEEQFPLFDPLHFVLMPMALKHEPPAKIIQTMNLTLRLCQQYLGNERCQNPETQALAYFVNLVLLFLLADRGGCTQNPVILRYGQVIDSICHS